MNYTTNYELRLPGLNDNSLVDDLNHNFSEIDEIMKANADAVDDLDERTDTLEGIVAKRYQHFVCLAGTSISVMFSFICDDPQEFPLNHILGFIEEETQCNGMYNGWAFNSIQMNAIDRVTMKSPDATQYQGMQIKVWTGMGVPVFTTATTLSIKEI